MQTGNYKKDNPKKPAIIITIIAVPQAFIMTFIILYGEYHGCEVADYFFIVSAVAMVLARVAFGKSYDRHGAKKTIIPSILLGIIALAVLLLMPNSFGFIVGATFYGISYGGSTPILTAESVRLENPERKGIAIATYYAGYDVGIGVGALIWGMLIEHWGYDIVFLMAILFMTAAMLISLKLD